MLPPSEGKTPPTGRARPLDLASLSSPGLGVARAEVVDALLRLGDGPEAIRTLGLGARNASEAGWNLRLHNAPAAPASRVYTGVLYGAAGLDDLPTPAARRRAARQVRIISGLWGALSPADRIPAYRLSMGASLPGVGPLARFWRPRLTAELADTSGLVVDCRSADYRAAWHPGPGTTAVQVRVERAHKGERTVISHDAKRSRGALVGHLLRRAGTSPRTPEALAAAAAERVGDLWAGVELRGDDGGAQTLVLITQ